MKKKQFTHDVVKCPHCQNTSRLVHLGQVENMQPPGQTEEGYPFPEQGDIYEVLECENCTKVTIRKYFWVSDWDGDDNQVEFKYLYPSFDNKRSYSLPPDVKKGLDSANAVKKIDANAYGVLLRRLLEHICIDQKASGGSLHLQLKDLANRGVIPNTLFDVANGLKNLGNIGAHAGTGDLSLAEADLMTSLCESIIEYVYYAPNLVQQSQALLDKVKKNKTHK